MHHLSSLLRHRKLETLVENKTTFACEFAELHLFETHQKAHQVALSFDHPVLASMLEGKKVMHLHEKQSFDFYPGESVMVPARQQMLIDFPQARFNEPTRCFALAIEESKIHQAMQMANETSTWGSDLSIPSLSFHFRHSSDIEDLIKRLVFVFSDDHPNKDMFVDLVLKELFVRIAHLQQHQYHKEENDHQQKSNILRFLVRYIDSNLDKDISVKELSEQVHMSESHLYRIFKSEVGVSPIDFINEKKISKAAHLLRHTKMKVKEVYLQCGFNNPSYFSRLFKKVKKTTPTEFRNVYSSK